MDQKAAVPERIHCAGGSTSHKRKIRVAVYARVSTALSSQELSLESQMTAYQQKIAENPDMVLTEVYADEGISGTKNDRPEYQRMLSDCRAGKLDLLLTKSISRFARNTVTLLQTVRELKTLNVDVYFEEQRIHSISAEGELMLTILASFAQEESRSVSENMKWRIKKSFEAGCPWNGTVLGYRMVNGRYVIVPHEAKIVKSIFEMYLSGMGYIAIADRLNKMGAVTRGGNEWNHASVLWVLHNYSYTGNLLLQTTYSENHITKKYRRNTGELPMYHVEGAHTPIISKEMFDAAQREMERRAEKYQRTENQNLTELSGKVFCGICGKRCRRKKRHDKQVWICNTFNMKGKAACPAKAVPEEILSDFIAEINGSIEKVEVCGDNILHFHLADSNVVTRQWQDTSRKDSWTDEMKTKAREKYYGSRNANEREEHRNKIGQRSPSAWRIVSQVRKPRAGRRSRPRHSDAGCAHRVRRAESAGQKTSSAAGKAERSAGVAWLSGLLH